MSQPPSVSRPDDRPDAASVSLARALRSCFRLLVAALLVAFAVYLWRSFFIVEQHQVGLILRFGQLLGATAEEQVLGDGLHLSFPHPIDAKIRVPAPGRVQRIESRAAWYGEATGQELPPTLKPGLDGYTLTGDLCIIHSQWTLRYRVTDPLRFAFAFAEAPDDSSYAKANEALRRLLNCAVTEASATLSIDQTWRRQQVFQDHVMEILRRDLGSLDLGIAVDSLQLEVSPPRQVAEPFNAVTRAEQKQGEIRNEARAYADRLAAEASREANRLRTAAESYRARKVSHLEASARYLDDLLADSSVDRQLLMQDRLTATLKQVFGQVGRKFILHQRDGRELRLLLKRPPVSREEER